MRENKTGLSARLSAVAAFVRPGSRIADIGTDHGYLPIALVSSGRALGAVASDIRPGPLERARRHIREAGLEDRIEVRLSDGLEGFAPGEADTVIIAGMGGPLILRILSGGGAFAASAERFILSPQSDWEGFREGLRRLGLTPVRERMVAEEGKYYLILEAVREEPDGEGEEIPPELAARFGRLLWKQEDPAFRQYLGWRRDILTGILHTLSACDTGETGEREREVREELAAVTDALALAGRYADAARTEREK